MMSPVLQKLLIEIKQAYDAWEATPWDDEEVGQQAYENWQSLLRRHREEQARIRASIIRPNAEPREEITDIERATKIAVAIVSRYGEAGCGDGDADWSGWGKTGYSRRGVEALEAGRVPYSQLQAKLKRVANLDRENTATEWHHVGTKKYGYREVYMYDPAVLEIARREIIRQNCESAIAPAKREKVAA